MDFVEGAMVSFPKPMKVGNAIIPAGAMGLVTQVLDREDDLIVKFNHGHDDAWNNFGIVRVAKVHVTLKSVLAETTSNYQKIDST